MSPLQSSTIYISSSPDSVHTSIGASSKDYESDSDLSIDESEGPQAKKQKLLTNKHHARTQSSSLYIPSNTARSYSLDKEHEPEATTSTTPNKEKHKTITKNQTNTSKDQTHVFKLANVSLQSDKEQSHKLELHPEAKAILYSLDSGTIDTKDIIPHRKKLVLLGVQRSVIYKTFKRFRDHVQMSNRQDTDKVLQIITESGKQATKIRSAYMPTSDELQTMLNKAYSGILPLENVQNLRDLLFREYTIEKATSYLQQAKKAFLKHKKYKEPLIQKAFQKKHIKRPIISSHYQNLQTKITSGSLNVNTFTHIYDSIPQAYRTRPLNRLCARYIKNLSYTTHSLEDKIELLKSLPLCLQNYPSTLNTIFPKESTIMAQIRTGVLSSRDLKTKLILLLKIISPKHAHCLLKKYVATNRHSSTNDKQNIDDCRMLLKQHAHTQPTSKNNKPDLHPRAKLILESLNNCSIKAEDIAASRQQLILLKVSKRTIKREFNNFKRKIMLSSRPDTQEIIKEIDGRVEASQIKHKESTPSNNLKTAIKSGNLEAQEFTRLYNSIVSQKEKAAVNNTVAIYIHDLSQQTPGLQQKLTTIKLLPKQLQTSVSTLKSFFPQQHAKMALIRSGQIKSEELKTTCLTLLDIVNITHIRRLLSKYVSNKRTMTVADKQYVAECRKVLLYMQRNNKIQSNNDIEEIYNENDEASTSTSLISNVPKQTETSIENKSDAGKQGTLTTKHDKEPSSPKLSAYTSTHNTNSWYTPEQPVAPERLVNILDEPTVSEAYIIEQHITNTQKSTFTNPIQPQPSTSCPSEIDQATIQPFYIGQMSSEFTTLTPSQPSTSYPIEIEKDTVQPFYIEQRLSDELGCALQSTDHENGYSEDQAILQHYILQLAKEIEQKSDIVEQITSTQEYEQPSTSKSNTYNKTINTQYTHTDEPIPDDAPSQIHEDFVHITDLAKSLCHEDFSQLADKLEREMPLQEIAPEEFFDFSNIDEK